MLERSDIDLILRQTIREESIERWWHTSIPSMDNKTPYFIWVLGERETVARLAIGYMKPLSYT
jgi:hypothetical protein